MRRPALSLVALLAFALLAYAVDVGQGASTAAIQSSFINAYNRGLFSLFVNAPTANVRALGTPGLVQEFPSKANTSVKYALIKPDPGAPVSANDTLQVSGDIYTYFTSVGVGTAGYPTMDTADCPANSIGTCTYQLFARNYGLFVYTAPGALNMAVRDPFYSVWSARGGVSGALGVVAGAETSVTSVSGVAGTQQNFSGGAIYSYPIGAATPSTYSVTGAFYSAWSGEGGYPALGFPSSEVIQNAVDGPKKQTFEAGRIEQSPGKDPEVLFPVKTIDITFAAQGLSLAPGGSATVVATALDTRGSTVLNRTLTWSSTNGAVVQVAGSGYSVTVRGVSAGTANVFVTSEGKTSPPISVRVGGACCQIGEGAPSQFASQAFQDAVSRNQLTVSLPLAAQVARVGNGYVQTVTAAGQSYSVSLADGASTAYVSSGSVYNAYAATGGYSGPMGYPVSDITGGVQRFASGAALAGSPVRQVPGVIASRWLQAGGAGGSLGNPTGDAAAFQSLTGSAGVWQTFAGGAVFASASGTTYLSGGLILARYLALSGPAGALGAPVGEIGGAGVLRQDFETGYIDLQSGATAAVEHFNPRKPAISPRPATVVPGGRVHISATGFAPGVTLSFTITGQPGFAVRAATGAFEWDVLVPVSARASVVTVQATAQGGADAASGSYTIAPAAALQPKLRLVSGDQQIGAPGSLLAAPIVATLADADGNPLAGVPVGWTLSPGASVVAPSATDASGRISGLLRLATSAGLTVGALNAGGQVVNFSALGSGKSLAGFPAFRQAEANGGLVAAMASVLRYQQNAGVLGVPNGQASVAAMTTYLSSKNGFARSDGGIAIPNPWVAAQFAGAGVVLEEASLSRVRDLLAEGTPAVLLLASQANGVPTGMTALSAVGVGADGAVLVSDPDPASTRTALSEYTGTLSAVLRFGPANPLNSFTVATTRAAGATAGSVYGACSQLLLGEPSGSGAVSYHYCDGARDSYEVDLASSFGLTLLDLSAGIQTPVPANSTVAWRIGRASGTLGAVPQALEIASVTDAAGFGASVSPGAIIAIFGTGLAAGGKSPSVTLGGRALQVLVATPFQINAVVPADVASSGSVPLQVSGAAGTATRALAVVASVPSIFTLGGLQGAVVNQDGTVNGPTNPALRGQFISIYGTGMGATTLRNGLQNTTTAVQAAFGAGSPIPVLFSGMVPGFVGLYQVNVQIPPATAPGFTNPLVLTQGGRSGNTVTVAIQ